MRDNCVRCRWVSMGSGADQPYYVAYHDNEWGQPQHDDRHLFEMLVLEGAQAGLSWATILKRRAGYRAVFRNFDVQAVAALTDSELEEMLRDERIIRNRLKVLSARRNAQVFLAIQAEFGSFDAYLWGFVGGRAVVTAWAEHGQVPVTTAVSDALSRDLKRRGMSFVGSVIMYAYLQAVGVVNDHTAGCFRAGNDGVKL